MWSSDVANGPALLATALGDGGDASVLLHLGSGSEAVALLDEGGEQPRCESLSGTRQRVEEVEVVVGGAALSDGVVARDGVEEGAELRREGFDQQLAGSTTPGSVENAVALLMLAMRASTTLA